MAQDYYSDLKARLGDDFLINVGEESGEGIVGLGRERFDAVAYKPHFSFLNQGLKDYSHLRTDLTGSSTAELYIHSGEYFQTREISPDYILHGNVLAVNKLPEQNFQTCSFEPIMGYLIGSDKVDYDKMIHGYSGGIELLSISARAPPELRAKLSTLTARTLAELHNNNILYGDPVPTNMRYDFADRILLHPHPYIGCNSNSDYERTVELALFLKTNRWVPDHTQFLKEYTSATGAPSEWRSLVANVEESTEELDQGLLPEDRVLAPVWLWN